MGKTIIRKCALSSSLNPKVFFAEINSNAWLA